MSAHNACCAPCLTVEILAPVLGAEIQCPAVGVAFQPPIARDAGAIDPYTGEYTVVPSQETQVLHTNGLRMLNDVTIAPIPSNYGLVTWNGYSLRIS